MVLAFACMGETQAIGPAPAAPLDRVQVTAGGEPSAVFEVPRAISVIGREEIDARMPEVLADALRALPGVFVQQTTAGQGIPIVRGLKGSEVLHLIDGFRINNAMFRNAPSQFLSLIDAQAVDRIEVLRGPSSARYGSDALGGVVQMISPTPEIADLSRTRASGLGRYGSAERSRLAHARLSHSGPRQGLEIGLTRQWNDDRRIGGGDRLPSAWRALAGDLVWQWQVSARHRLLVDLQYAEQPATPRVDALVAGFGQQQPESSQFVFSPNTRLFTRLRHEAEGPWRLADGFRLQLGRQVVRDDRRSSPAGSSRQDFEQNRSTLFGLVGDAHKDLGRHRLTIGGEWYRDEIDSTRQRLEGDVFSPRASRFPDGADQTSLAFWLHERWQPNPSWQLDAGLRVSRFRLSLPASEERAAMDSSKSRPAADLGVRYRLGPDLNLVAGVGQAVRAPNIFDVSNLGPRPGNRFGRPNPALSPETARAAELGLRARPGTVQWEVFAWATRIEDRIVSVDTGEVTEDGEQIVENRNAARAELRGLEASGIWQAHPRLQLRAVINYTHGRQRDADRSEPGDRIPPLNGELRAVWQTRPALRLEAWVAAAGRQDRLSARDASDPRIDPAGTAGWSSFGISAAWSPSPEWHLQAQLENLTDRAFREHGSGLDRPGRGVAVWLRWNPD